MRKRTQPFIQVFKDLDIDVIDVDSTGSCHYRITVEAKGKRRFFIAACSASDKRTLLNFRGDVRRWLNGLEQ
jgi:hypothetical protein